MYESFIPDNRLPTQLTEAIQLERMENQAHDSGGSELIRMPDSSQNDSQAIRVGRLIGARDGTARAHTYKRRVDGAGNLSNENLAETLRKVPASGARTMPRRKRGRKMPK